jgi:hypothetical protein
MRGENLDLVAVLVAASSIADGDHPPGPERKMRGRATGDEDPPPHQQDRKTSQQTEVDMDGVAKSNKYPVIRNRSFAASLIKVGEQSTYRSAISYFPLPRHNLRLQIDIMIWPDL